MSGPEIDDHGMRWESATATDRGLIRPNNEDAALECSDAGVFAVADGMGGHAAGEVASRMAIDALRAEVVARNEAGTQAEPIVRAFSSANDEIHRRGRAESDKRGMGTTLTVLRLEAGHNRGVIAHVGDSRAYRLRAGRLELLTRDHTWVQERVDAGVLTESQARSHPYSSILTRVLGTDADVAPDVVAIVAEPGDVFLLCSDGLSGMVTDQELEDILKNDNDLQDLAGNLIEAAKAGGGFDNITLVLVRALAD